MQIPSALMCYKIVATTEKPVLGTSPLRDIGTRTQINTTHTQTAVSVYLSLRTVQKLKYNHCHKSSKHSTVLQPTTERTRSSRALDTSMQKLLALMKFVTPMKSFDSTAPHTERDEKNADGVEAEENHRLDEKRRKITD